MKFLNTNFLQRNDIINNNAVYTENRFFNFLYLICIIAFIMVFLVGCGPSINCNDGTVKDKVLELSKQIIQKNLGSIKLDLELSDIETVSKDGDSCECIAELEISAANESITTVVTYTVTKTDNIGEVYVYVEVHEP
ncbi:MAG: hypothetical protein LBF40_04595 [Deltaproteobacteria bacterium]|jgi:hypothetical protein|nr:hypothetical protein [Deltaproteobacteria bacterium]